VSILSLFQSRAFQTGNTGRIRGFGGAPLGNLFRTVTDDDAVALVRHAYDDGVRYFDTAPHYGQGLSERRIGVALRGLSRDSFLVSTKVGRLLTPASDLPRTQNGYVDGLPFLPHYDYTRDGVLRSIEDSLRRLTMDRVDFVFVHDIDVPTHGDAHPQRFRDMLDGALPALASLKASGAIGGYGLGVNDVGICVDTLRHADLDLILLAGRYTLVDQTALVTLLPECVRRDVAVIVGGPFNSGILASGSLPADGSRPWFNYAPAPDEVIERVAAIEAACAEFGVPLKAAALQFPTGHPAVACVLPGARSCAEFDDNAAMTRFPIPASFWQALRGRSLLDAAVPLPGAAV
jgi:D-threo-aldose 1-dehydrogenase